MKTKNTLLEQLVGFGIKHWWQIALFIVTVYVILEYGFWFFVGVTIVITVLWFKFNEKTEGEKK